MTSVPSLQDAAPRFAPAPAASAPFRLDGRTALVTGAGSGIGRAIAERFAAQGAHVVVCDRDAEAADETAARIAAAGGQAVTRAVDVSDAAAVDAAFAEVARDHGGLHLLVNNAGVAHVGRVEQVDDAAFERVLAVNVRGVFHCLRAGVREMLASGGGAIVNMGSIASLIGVEDRFAYSMSKGAVLAMTKSVAIDYVKQGIRCNCICPARVHTPFVDGYLAANYPGQEAEMFARLSAYQPIGRMGTPEEVAALALYLCSDEAAFVTGQAYPIDGGVLR